MSSPITAVPHGVYMFPDPADVFSTDVEQHAALLFPIFSIDLVTIDPQWTGRIHMLVYNYDPYNTATTTTFNTYCKDNSVGFDMVSGKYRFKTGFKFFDLSEDWMEPFEKTKTLFATSKDHFRATGELPMRFEQTVPFIDQLGGDPHWVQYDETPKDPDGRPMRFIARVNSWNYADDMCGRVLFLFYSHEHQLAVIVDQCD